MTFNWLDIILLIIIGVMIILGLIKGFLRQILGLVGIVAGFILALSFYPEVAGFLLRFIQPSVLTELLGFLIIFLGIVFVGYFLAHLLGKALKGPIKFFDRVLGGFFGFLKGVLIGGILLLALVLFPVNPSVIKASRVAPLCLGVTRGVVYLIPQKLKDKFNETYRQIIPQAKPKTRGKNARRI
ncbi:CvpA family protein [Candidatus Aminicenantes bacterium AC-334-K16]|jgi:membrane protein required for colicin V production|nr:CvpA family protein [Candidatus Aminicenantes bacterium AC-334-K16]